MNEIESILDELRRAATSADSDAVEMWIGQLELPAMDEPKWPDDLFQGVKSLMLDDQFLAIDSSWHLAHLVEQSWDDLTAQQRGQLAPVWPRSFDKFGNWMGAFVTAEILGERYADEAAFKTLDDLSRTARMPHRALAAYGLYKLARTVGEGQLHDRAIERLRTLAGSSVDEIRQEASEALVKLKKQ